MTTAWTLLASEICTDALQHLGVLTPDEVADGAEIVTALRGLDVVLKELPLHGYLWPKLSAESALAWGGSGVQTITLPSDYYGYLVVWQTVNGQKSPLTQIPHADWVQMTNRTASGAATHFYVNPSNVLYLYPVATTDPQLTIQYMRIVDDTDRSTTPDVLQTMKGALGYGVADAISLKFKDVPAERRLEVAQRWGAKRELVLQGAIPMERISFEVLE